MFHLTLVSVFALSSIYIYFRIRSLIDDHKYKRIFTWFFIPLALVMPAAEFLSRFEAIAGMKGLSNIGYYVLAWFFYLYLFLLLSDMLLGFGRILKIVSFRTVRSRTFHHLILLILIVLPITVVVAGRSNYANIKISEYHISVPRKFSQLDHLKIVLASDFHLGEQTDEKFMSRFVEKVNLQHPDIVLIPGDLVEGDNLNWEAAEFEKQFRQITSKYGVFASLGNHEHHGMQGPLEFFKRSNIKVLPDAVQMIDRAFYLVGRNENHFYNRKPLEELLRYTSGSLPVIVLDHRPEGFDLVSKSPVDIQVSGHTHNGQLYPLNYVMEYLYDLSWGHKKIRNTDFFVTSGIQGWGPHVRTAGVAELMIIDVDLTS
jgi:predicted MPP superfamily phosphohydrolase